VIPHRVDEIRHAIAAWGLAVPTSAGLFGGEPAAPNRIVCHRDSGALAQLRAGHIPRGVAELGGTEVHPAQRSEGLRQGPDDVWVTSWCGGAGYGDPFDREPARVMADVQAGTISPERASGRYGVPDEASAPEARSARRRAVAG
jgi:N-methylhydantoinase B